MMNQTRSILSCLTIFCILLCSHIAQSAGQRFTPGLYEITIQNEIPGGQILPAQLQSQLKKQVMTYCIRKGQTLKKAATDVIQQQGCKIGKISDINNEFKWKAQCQGIADLTGTGTIKISKWSFNGQNQTTAKLATGMNLKIISKYAGIWNSKCK